jgi:hypothetical protein
MRIGLTDYYTTTRRIIVRDGKSAHPDLVKGYVLSVYGRSQEQIYAIMYEMRRQHIYSQYKTFIEDDIPLPHILIIDPQSVEKLNNQFRAQNIPVPDDECFKKQTDWEDVLDFEEQRHQTRSQKFATILANKAHYYASKARYQKNRLVKKIYNAFSR